MAPSSDLSLFSTTQPSSSINNTSTDRLSQLAALLDTSTTSFNMTYTGADASLANAIALAVFGILTTCLAYLPARSFINRKNIPAISVVLCTVVGNLFYTVNAIIWHSDRQVTWYQGYGLCDVEASLKYPFTTAFAASLTALSRSLANCLDASNGPNLPSKAQRRRKYFIDLAICWAIPVLQMGLQYIIQNGRYGISPVFGCSFDVDDSWPSIPIIIIWSPLFTAITMWYAGKIDLLLHSCMQSLLSRSSSASLSILEASSHHRQDPHE